MCVCVIGFKINVRLGVVVVGSGCFYPSTHVSGDEDGLFPGKPLHAQQNETGQRDSWGIGRHVWTDARYQSCFVKWLSVVINISTWYLHTHTHTHMLKEKPFFNLNVILFYSSGCGIGTGPGVIQDRYSPTMGRHRTNPLFNGHSGHIAPPPQSQFDMGPKSFVKSNQVILPTVERTGLCSDDFKFLR